MWSNILWGQRSNFVGVPTDCPQRDERLGWTADAQVFWRNRDLQHGSDGILRNSARIARDASRTAMYGIFAPGNPHRESRLWTGWSDAGVIIPWTSWIQTGDKKIIEENWEGMGKYLAAIQAAIQTISGRKTMAFRSRTGLHPRA